MTVCVRKAHDSVKNIIHFGRAFEALQPAKPIGKSGTGISSMYQNVIIRWPIMPIVEVSNIGQSRSSSTKLSSKEERYPIIYEK